ncbi:MAG: hypothetical protein ACRDCA_21975 [Serratia sp. (in: enterobacteria)]|uniref:hypothetical protein n=1 Tax=Serratia sp. (in: enterobacteria) TaxID=616 RepID=UPI003F3B8821
MKKSGYFTLSLGGAMLLAISLTTSAVEFGFDPEVLGTSLPEVTDLSAFAYEGGNCLGFITLKSR